MQRLIEAATSNVTHTDQADQTTRNKRYTTEHHSPEHKRPRYHDDDDECDITQELAAIIETHMFDDTMDTGSPSSGLQQLTFGDRFDQSLDSDEPSNGDTAPEHPPPRNERSASPLNRPDNGKIKLEQSAAAGNSFSECVEGRDSGQGEVIHDAFDDEKAEIRALRTRQYRVIGFTTEETPDDWSAVNMAEYRKWVADGRPVIILPGIPSRARPSQPWVTYSGQYNHMPSHGSASGTTPTATHNNTYTTSWYDQVRYGHNPLKRHPPEPYIHKGSAKRARFKEPATTLAPDTTTPPPPPPQGADRADPAATPQR